MKKLIAHFGAFVAVAAVFGCVPDMGGEGAPCNASGTCFPGLVCDDRKMCVQQLVGGDGGVATDVGEQRRDSAEGDVPSAPDSGDSGSDAASDTSHPSDASNDAADTCAGKDDFTWCKKVDAPDRAYDICVSETCVSPGCGDQTCNEPGPHFVLPDTDQRACYDNSTTMTCTTFPCIADGTPNFCGQDWQYGWDTTHAQTARYTKTEPVAGQPLVADSITGLEWEDCPAELSGSSCTIGSVQTKTWAVALTYCEGLTWAGQTDWRLPDTYELRSIADYGRSSPAIDTTTFPATPSTYFWSSTSYAADASGAWYVGFVSGNVSNAAKTANSNARCVRGGP